MTIEDIRKQFGKNVQTERKNKKYKQRELAEALGITREHLAKIETGHRFPSFALLFKLCQVLEIEEAKLFKEIKNEIS